MGYPAAKRLSLERFVGQGAVYKGVWVPWYAWRGVFRRTLRNSACNMVVVCGNVFDLTRGNANCCSGTVSDLLWGKVETCL